MSEIRSPKLATLLLLLCVSAAAMADGQSALVQERTAIERVYYNHRLGQKPPFEQVSPPSLIERLVRLDLRKETALKRVYGVKITPAMLEAEVQRINTTTRAPEMLAEIKAALDNNPEQFANAFAKPFLVERLLRSQFENDDAVHAARRHECEQARNELLTAKANGASPAELLALLKRCHTNEVREMTWQLTPRPAETNEPSADELEIRKRFGPKARLLSLPHARDTDRKFYFEDLPGDLQNVLRAQLNQAGDVSAVIETPGGFLMYICKEKCAQAITVACLSLPKRDYEQWLHEQSEGIK